MATKAEIRKRDEARATLRGKLERIGAIDLRVQTDPRVVGGTYRSGYWGQTYVVEARKDDGGLAWFAVRWEDGHKTIHCTAWDARRDTIIAVPA